MLQLESGKVFLQMLAYVEIYALFELGLNLFYHVNKFLVIFSMLSPQGHFARDR